MTSTTSGNWEWFLGYGIGCLIVTTIIIIDYFFGPIGVDCGKFCRLNIDLIFIIGTGIIGSILIIIALNKKHIFELRVKSQ